MSVNLAEIIDISDVIYAAVFALLPLLIFAISLIKPRGLYYVTISLVIFSVLAVIYAHYEIIWGYVIAWIIFCVIWVVKGGREYERYDRDYNIYRKLFESYYADDLNDDGIIDAFDSWKIAHDPRYAWIFTSRKKRMEAKDTNVYEQRFTSRHWQDESSYSYKRKDNGSEGGYRTSPGGTYGRTPGKTYAKPEGAASMTEEERKVAAQHAFARRNNLRYFAMCEDKEEGKKLYHKYAAKFHPDNPTTGDQDKFIRIDEEYNRFCEIPDAEFPM